MSEKAKKRELDPEAKALMVEAALGVYDKEKNARRGDSLNAVQLAFFSKEAFTKLPEEVQGEVRRAIIESEQTVLDERPAQEIIKEAAKLKKKGQKERALKMYQDVFDRKFYQRQVISGMVELLVELDRTAEAQAFVNRLKLEKPEGVKKEWVTQAGKALPAINQSTPVSATDETIDGVEVKKLPPVKSEEEEDDPKEREKIKRQKAKRESRMFGRVLDETAEDPTAGELRPAGLIQDFLDYERTEPDAILLEQYVEETVREVLAVSGIDVDNISEEVKKRVDGLVERRGAIVAEVERMENIKTEKLSVAQRAVKEKEAIVKCVYFLGEGGAEALLDQGERPIQTERLGELLEFLEWVEGKGEGIDCSEWIEKVKDLMSDALFLERRELEMTEELRKRLGKIATKAKVAKYGEEEKQTEVIKKDADTFGDDIMLDLHHAGIPVYKEERGSVVGEPIVVGQETFMVEGKPSFVDEEQGESYDPIEGTVTINRVIGERLVEKPLGELLQTMDKHFEPFKVEVERVKQEISQASINLCHRLLGNRKYGMRGEIEDLRSRFEGELVDYVAVEDLASRIARSKPGEHVSQDLIDYWKNYVDEVRTKVRSLGDEVARQTKELQKLAEDRLWEIRQEQIEKFWREEKLPAAISDELDFFQVKWDSYRERRKERAQAYFDKEAEPRLKAARERDLQRVKDFSLSIPSDWGVDVSIEVAAGSFLRRFISPLEKQRYAPSQQSQHMRWDEEKWRGVVQHFLNKLGQYTPEEIATATAQTTEQRRSDKAFGYNNLLDWKWQMRDRYPDGKVPNMTPKQVLKECKLKPGSADANRLLELFDYLRAIQDLRRKTKQEDSEMRRNARSPRPAPEDEATKRRREEIERQRVAERQRFEKLTPQERYLRKEYEARAEFYALAVAHGTGREDKVEAYLKAGMLKQRDLLGELYAQAMEQRGVALPGRVFRNLEAGEQYVQDWDRFEVRKPDGGTETFNAYIRGYDPLTQEIILQRVDRRTLRTGQEERIKQMDIIKYENPQPKSLDGRIAVQLAKRAGISLRSEGLEYRNVHVVEAGESLPGKININTGCVQGNRFDDARDHRYGRLDGQRNVRAKEGSPEALFQEYFRLRKNGRHKDFFKTHDIDPETLTEFIDHHSDESDKQTSAAKYLFEKLDALGMFNKLNEEDRKLLERVLEFVERDDNKSHPEWHRGDRWNWEKDSPYTLLGIGHRLSLGILMEFYRKYKDDPDADIRRFSQQDIDQFSLQEFITAQETSVEESMTNLEFLERNGSVVKDTKLGTLVVMNPSTYRDSRGQQRVVSPVIVPIDAIRSKYGPDSAMMIWSPLIRGGKMFISTAGDDIADLPVRRPDFRYKIGNAQIIRGTMAIGHQMSGDLKDVLGFLMQDESQLEALQGSGSKFASYVNEGELIQEKHYRHTRLETPKDFDEFFEGEGPADIKEYVRKYDPDLLAPLPLEVGREGTIYIAGASAGGESSVVNYKTVIVDAPGFDRSSISPEKRYWLEPKKIVIDERHGSIGYFVEIIREVEISPEVVELETQLKQSIEEDLRTQGIKDVGPVTAYDIARLLGGGYFDQYLEAREKALVAA